jgi:hypothetical protein
VGRGRVRYQHPFRLRQESRLMGQERDDKQADRPVRFQDGCYYCGTAKTCERCTIQAADDILAEIASKPADENLAALCEKHWLDSIAARMLSDVEADLSSRRAYEERQDIALSRLRAPVISAPSPSSSPVPSPLPEGANPGVGGVETGVPAKRGRR